MTASNHRTRTIVGIPAPLHLPAGPLHSEDTEVDAPPYSEDAVVVDVEVNGAGQIVIANARRP
jgi:hypothetical protein